MSNDASNLLSLINSDYQERLNNGISKNGAVAFYKIPFARKHNYDGRVLEALLEELKQYGYIKKWITGDFEFKVD